MAKILIKTVMEEKGTNINRLQGDMAMSRATAYRISDGTKSPCLEELEEFAKALEVPLEDLYYSEYSSRK